MYTVYILQNVALTSYYIGYTKNMMQRLKQHNSGSVRSTKSKRPWVIVYVEYFEDKHSAWKREMQIKSYKGGHAFVRLLKGVHKHGKIA